MPHVLYLTHDLNDAATWRRVDMLRRGGAGVMLAGFHRGAPPPAEGEVDVIALGTTANGRMVQRGAAVARALATLRRRMAGVAAPDVILARNLETLALAPRLRLLFRSARPALVYECLDIHRMMLGSGLRARLLRAAERMLAADARLVLTSSPAFVREYFRPMARLRAPIRVVENRTLPPLSAARHPPTPRPVRIGWFGVLRCRTSLRALDTFTRAHPGQAQVVLRGRPALDVIPDFHAVVAANPDLSFGGAYAPADLPVLYGDIHYSWLIDRYEAGQNSEWLLPNRLYEGGAHGAVPVTLRGTETAAFLARRGLGVRIAEPTGDALAAALLPVAESRWLAQRAAVLAQPQATWCYDTADCRALVDQLTGAAGGKAARQTGAAPELAT